MVVHIDVNLGAWRGDSAVTWHHRGVCGQELYGDEAPAPVLLLGNPVAGRGD